MHRDDVRQLEAVFGAVMAAVGDGVAGAYLYGSAVLGGLRPRSDIDVFVVLDRPTVTDERRLLVGELMQLSGRRGTRISGRPVELTMVCREELRPWRPGSRREFQYGEWLRDDYEAGYVPEPVVDPDLAPLVATLLTASRALIGPPAEVLLDPVPEDDLVSAMHRGVPPLLSDLAEDTVNVLLTLARVAYTIAHASIATKDEAAFWALTELPPDTQEPLALARSIYLGEIAPPLPARQADSERTAQQIVTQLIDL